MPRKTLIVSSGKSFLWRQIVCRMYSITSWRNRLKFWNSCESFNISEHKYRNHIRNFRKKRVLSTSIFKNVDRGTNLHWFPLFQLKRKLNNQLRFGNRMLDWTFSYTLFEVFQPSSCTQLYSLSFYLMKNNTRCKLTKQYKTSWNMDLIRD